MSRQIGDGRPIGPLLVAAYLLAAPLLAGIPRSTIAPLVRPNEVVQLAMTAVGLVLVAAAAATGARWSLRLGPTERWLATIVVTSSLVPILSLLARGLPVRSADLVASLPFIKYSALYLLVRASVRTERDAVLIVRAAVGGALAICLIAIAQTAGVGPVTDALGRWFISSPTELVDDGRATTTIGSAVATGGFLAMSCGLALSCALATGGRAWYLATLVLGAGTIATGQIGAVIALTLMVLIVAHLHRRLGLTFSFAVPAIAVGFVLLWPILSARLADRDASSGLPTSWLIRWTNITELYWPSLADGGWILGVSPDVVLVPPDVWRDRVFLESGYLWLLWVGGVPLLVAAVGFLISAWRDLRDAAATVGSLVDAARIAAMAAVAMITLTSVVDPHLTLRIEADLLFTLLAVGLAGVPFLVREQTPARWWRDRLLWPSHRGVAGPTPGHLGARLQISEATRDATQTEGVETGISLTVRAGKEQLSGTTLLIQRGDSGLHGFLAEPVRATDPFARTLIWRAIALCARSLPLETLRPSPSHVCEHGELQSAGRLAELCEGERAGRGAAAETELADCREPGRAEWPPVRLVPGSRLPWWKRAADLTIGSVCLVISAPIWIVCAAAIRLTSSGPILFRQLRIGSGGLPFQIYKFRTMYVDNDDRAHRESNRRELLEGAAAAKLDDDVRVTTAGRWLRRSSLDELPQLLNVLRGEMSLVGPRPSLLWEVELFEPRRRRRLSVLPGMTGLWQVSGRADVSMTTMLDMDLEYVDTMSPSVDLRCLRETATTVLAGRGAR